MPVDPALAPLTETVTIEADAAEVNGLAAFTFNGPHRILLALKPTDDAPFLVVDLRHTLPGVRPDDVLDLLAAGKTGDFAVEVRTTRPASRRDADFGGAF